MGIFTEYDQWCSREFVLNPGKFIWFDLKLYALKCIKLFTAQAIYNIYKVKSAVCTIKSIAMEDSSAELPHRQKRLSKCEAVELCVIILSDVYSTKVSLISGTSFYSCRDYA